MAFLRSQKVLEIFLGIIAFFGFAADMVYQNVMALMVGFFGCLLISWAWSRIMGIDFEKKESLRPIAFLPGVLFFFFSCFFFIDNKKEDKWDVWVVNDQMMEERIGIAAPFFQHIRKVSILRKQEIPGYVEWRTKNGVLIRASLNAHVRLNPAIDDESFAHITRTFAEGYLEIHAEAKEFFETWLRKVIEKKESWEVNDNSLQEALEEACLSPRADKWGIQWVGTCECRILKRADLPNQLSLY